MHGNGEKTSYHGTGPMPSVNSWLQMDMFKHINANICVSCSKGEGATHAFGSQNRQTCKPEMDFTSYVSRVTSGSPTKGDQMPGPIYTYK